MVISARPCEPWPATLCCEDDLPADVPAETIDQALMVSTEILWALSGRRFGTCTVGPMRPCCKRCVTTGWPVDLFPWWGTTLPVGVWPSTWAWDVHCGSCQASCGSEPLEEIVLPKRPVVQVTEVRVDGGIAPSGGIWRVDDYAKLVRTDGGSWPQCQDMNLAPGDPNAFEVTWRYGKPVPSSGLLAQSILGCEVVKACLGLPCELPNRLTQLTRQGVSMAFLDPQEYLEEGRTGIYLVDLFLKSFNPNKLQRRSRVRRADSPHQRWRRVGT